MKNSQQLPAGWKLEKLGSLLEMCQYGISAPSVEEGKYPMFRMNNFTDGKAVVRNMAFVNLTEKEAKTFTLHKGDILFNRTNSLELVGKTGLFESEGEYVFASYLVRLRVNSAIADARFVNYFLNKTSTKGYLKKLATAGVSQCNINPRTLQDKVVLPLPPLAEQQRIAAVLETWDEAIHTQAKLVAALRVQQRALRQVLLTGLKRLPGFTDKWETVKANTVFYSVSVRNHAHEPLLSATQEYGIIPRSMLEGRVVMPEAEATGYKLVEPGDFIISLRSFQGGLEYSTYRGLVSPAYTVLKPHHKIDDAFYREYFKSERFIRRLGMTLIGIRDGKQVSFSDFGTIAIPAPALPEQQAIATVLNTAAKEISLREAELKALREQKHGLMQQLLTGQLRVSDAPTL